MRVLIVEDYPELVVLLKKDLAQGGLPADSVGTAADCTVHVLDDGPGVPEVDHESVFQRFWRRDRARADSRGLGLAIVARVAEAHGGAVGVRNRPEGGAMFTLKLRSA